MQASTALRIVKTSAVREAVAAQKEATPAQQENVVKDLALLASSIADATEQELRDPNSEGRMAIDVLVNLAAATGPAGALAREALCQTYEQLSFNGNPVGCNALRNASLQMCEKKSFGVDEDLSITVAYLGGRAELPPIGNNGGGKTDAISKHITQLLPAELEHKVDVLDQDRPVTGIELLAVRTKFQNLHVMPDLLDTTSNASGQHQADALRRSAADRALSSQKPAAYWLHFAGEPRQQWQALVAEPKSGGSIHWHLLTPDPSDASSVPDCVTCHHIGSDGDSGLKCHLILKALEDNPNDPQGVGEAIQKYIANDSGLSDEARKDIELVARAELLQAAAGRPDEAHVVVQMPPPEIVVSLPVDATALQPAPAAQEPPPMPASPVPKLNESAKTADSCILDLREKHAALNLRIVKKEGEGAPDSYHVESSISDLARAYNTKSTPIKEPQKPGDDAAFEATMEKLKPLGVDSAFLDKAVAYSATFESMGKSDLLKSKDCPRPLQAASTALGKTGKQVAFLQMLTRMQMPLDACYQEASKVDRKPLSMVQLKGGTGEIAGVQTTLLRNVANAIIELEKVCDANRETMTSWAEAGITDSDELKGQAASLIRALTDLRDLATRPIFTNYSQAIAPTPRTHESLTALKQTLEGLSRP